MWFRCFFLCNIYIYFETLSIVVILQILEINKSQNYEFFFLICLPCVCQMKSEVEKLPRNQRKDSMKQQMSLYSQTKLTEVRYNNNINKNKIKNTKFLSAQWPAFAVGPSTSKVSQHHDWLCEWLCAVGTEVPGCSEDRAGHHCEEDHWRKQKGDRRHGAWVPAEETTPGARWEQHLTPLIFLSQFHVSFLFCLWGSIIVDRHKKHNGMAKPFIDMTSSLRSLRHRCNLKCLSWENDVHDMGWCLKGALGNFFR